MIIGITGKSGSGKSELADIVSKRFGGVAIHFDEISHKIVESDWYTSFVQENFGKEFIQNKKVNRKKLGELVFSDPQKLERINSACEPQMEKIIDEIIKKNKSKTIVLEYVLLPLMKYFDFCDLKILLECHIDERKRRVIERDKISEDYFHSREENSIYYENYNFDLKFDTEHESLEKIANHIGGKLC